MAKTRRMRLKQFAILSASDKIAFSPESHNLAQNPTCYGFFNTKTPPGARHRSASGFARVAEKDGRVDPRQEFLTV
jgi:hypothetical protein